MIERKGELRGTLVKNTKGSTLLPLFKNIWIPRLPFIRMSTGATGISAISINIPSFITKEANCPREDHTNKIERFFREFKRGVFGIYHHLGF